MLHCRACSVLPLTWPENLPDALLAQAAEFAELERQEKEMEELARLEEERKREEDAQAEAADEAAALDALRQLPVEERMNLVCFLFNLKKKTR